MKPYEDSPAAQLINSRIWELSTKKTQAAIASQVGFPNANMLTHLKSGRAKVPLDRVLPLAEALEIEPSLLMRLALDQAVGSSVAKKIVEIFTVSVNADGCKHCAPRTQSPDAK
jgi:hypothetical protein